MRILVYSVYVALLANGVVNAQPAIPATHAESTADELITKETRAATPVAEPVSPSETAVAEDILPVPDTSSTEAVQTAILPEGTRVVVMMNDEVSTFENNVGDRFGVTILHDVIDRGTIVIPQGAIGYGEVTFRSGKGGFGKPGILGISLRKLDVGEKTFALDGRYREEGQSKNTAVAATWFAVGIFSGFIKGKAGVIPKGRELKARTAEDISFIVGAAPPPVPVPDNPEGLDQPELVEEIDNGPSLSSTEEIQQSINQQVPVEPDSD